MGVISDLLTSVGLMEIATEADDITGDVSSQADDIMGTGDGDSGDSPRELEEGTDDILGTKGGDDGSGDPDSESSDIPGDDGEDSEDDLGNDNMEDDGTSDGETGDDNPNDPSGDDPDGTLNENEEDPFAESRKRKIKKQFMHLYDVIDNSVKLISTYTPNVTDVKYIQTIDSIKDNLIQCKEIIYNLAVKDFQAAEYHELLKKYVSINRIYELSIKSLEKYFEEYKKEHGAGKNKGSTDA